MPATTQTGVCNLPPLILHPFNERVEPQILLDNSKAALMLSGLMPADGTEDEVLRRRVALGRYTEIRMLFFLGKDVTRWLDQCVDTVGRLPALENSLLTQHSFAGLLAHHPPQQVKEKLDNWGVADYSAIFSRALGIHALFQEPPLAATLSEEFLRNYHRYADALFRCYMESEPHAVANPSRFSFELYASGEYSRLLESQWQQDDTP